MAASVSTKTVYRFGTSGYRNNTEPGFNEAVVIQITAAIKDYLIETIEKTGQLMPVLLGGDTREKTRQFIPVIAQYLQAHGLDVLQSQSDIPSPVLALAARDFRKLNPDIQTTLGAILMTASHNPWDYGGYNFLTPDAAVMPTPVSKQFEANQENPLNKALTAEQRQALGGAAEAQIVYFDGYALYRDHLNAQLKIDYPAIAAAGIQLFYDAMYATGRQYFPRLLKEAGIEITAIHNTDVLPAGYTGMPEPTGSNLTELADQIKTTVKPGGLAIGLANDGDADRFGVLDEMGVPIGANDVLFLILHHLVVNKKQHGVVVRSQATTHALDALAQHYGLEVQQTPVGYKYIAEAFIEREEKQEKPVLIGGESSGGVSVLGHIPEKDGILACLLITELLAYAKKPIGQVLADAQASLDKHYQFRELGIKTDQGKAIIDFFIGLVESDSPEIALQAAGLDSSFSLDIDKTRQEAEQLIKHYNTRDGVKLYLKNNAWFLLRASGTEPIVRVYAEGVGHSEGAATQAAVQLINAITQILIHEFSLVENAIKERK
ncbi:MAG: hypothetical protein AAGI66_03455 [Cyanobacteria bacterium P01_H01_bin.74]